MKARRVEKGDTVGLIVQNIGTFKSLTGVTPVYQ